MQPVGRTFRLGSHEDNLVQNHGLVPLLTASNRAAGGSISFSVLFASACHCGVVKSDVPRVSDC